jgi:hypothetical protein
VADGRLISDLQSAIAHTVDFYLHDQYRKELGHIVDLSLQESDDSLEILAGYYREARRLAPQCVELATPASSYSKFLSTDLQYYCVWRPGARK